jgi:hypothetical protein
MLTLAHSPRTCMTAIPSIPLAPIGRPIQRELDTIAHRRLQKQLIPLDALEYTPDRLVRAVTEFCQTRRLAGASCEQVLEECRTIAASRLDISGVRLVRVLAEQSLICPVPEELDKYRVSTFSRR